MSAEDDVTFASILIKNKIFIQTTDDGIKEKALLLPQRINDTFLKYADKIDFYWREGVKEEAKLTATWIRNAEASSTLGTLQIVDKELYEKIKYVHNNVVKFLQRPDLEFEISVEERSAMIVY